MSENHSFYYMKVKEDFYESEEIILLESMPDGHLYSNILMKMYLKSLRNEGKLMIRDRIPYSPSVLAQVVRQPVAVVEKALHLFTELGLVEVLDNGAIFMLDIQEYIGHLSSEGERKKKYRAKIAAEKRKALPIGTKSGTESGTLSQKNGTLSQECPSVRPPEIEIEINKEKEKEKEKEKMPVVPRLDFACGDRSPVSEWERTLGITVTAHLAEKLKDLYEEVGDYAYVRALEIACERNKRSFNYVEATARNIAAGNEFTEKRKPKVQEETNPIKRQELTDEQKEVLALFRQLYA